MGNTKFIWIFGLIWFQLFLSRAGAETKYACIANMGDGEDPGEFEMEEFEPGEMEEGEGTASGSLTCSSRGSRDQRAILVTRVAYGFSMGGTCAKMWHCKEEFDTGGAIADTCDGRPSCFVNLVPTRILRCGRRSSYVMVEYECVDLMSSFEICESAGTSVRAPYLYIMSPGYLNPTSPNYKKTIQMCECIVQSKQNDDVLLDMLQTDLTDTNDQCPYEYVLLENKRNLTQKTVDESKELCGRRRIGNLNFPGTLRITYATGGPMEKKGFVGRFSSNSSRASPELMIECGTVNTQGIELKPPPASEYRHTSRSQRPRPGTIHSYNMVPTMNQPMQGPMFPSYDMEEYPMTRGPGPGGYPFMVPPFSSVYRQPPRMTGSREQEPGEGGSRGSVPDVTRWKFRGPDSPRRSGEGTPSLGDLGVNRPPRGGGSGRRGARGGGRQAGGRAVVRQQVAAETVPISRAPSNPAVNINPRQPKTKNKPKAGVNKKGGVQAQKSSADSDTGGMVGLIMGCIGAVLILGSVGILFIHNARKRRRIKRKEQEQNADNSSTYGQGWELDSVYATIAEVAENNPSCANPAADNRYVQSSPDDTKDEILETSLSSAKEEKPSKRNENETSLSSAKPKEKKATVSFAKQLDEETSAKAEEDESDESDNSTDSTHPGDTKRHVAVIEVHNNFYGQEDSENVIRNTDECTELGMELDPADLYAIAKRRLSYRRERVGKDANIEQRPRQTQRRRRNSCPYDNNVNCRKLTRPR